MTPGGCWLSLPKELGEFLGDFAGESGRDVALGTVLDDTAIADERQDKRAVSVAPGHAAFDCP